MEINTDVFRYDKENPKTDIRTIRQENLPQFCLRCLRIHKILSSTEILCTH